MKMTPRHRLDRRAFLRLMMATPIMWALPARVSAVYSSRMGWYRTVGPRVLITMRVLVT